MNTSKHFEIKKILIPFDFSETAMLALEHGGFMANLFKADVVLLHVVEKKWQSFSVIDSGLSIRDVADFTEKATAKLNEVASDIRKKYNIKPQLIVNEGNIFNEIAKVSQENDIDIIIMGTHGASGLQEFFVGSNTYKVVTLSPCPVLSVQTHPQKIGFKNICLPIDLSPHALQKVDYAIEIAKKYSAKIFVIGTVSETENDKKFELKLEQVKDHIKKSGIIVESNMIIGRNQANMTLKYAEDINADLIVIMTDQDENISGRLLGTYSQQIVNHSNIPVLTVPPSVNAELLDSTHPWG